MRLSRDRAIDVALALSGGLALRSAFGLDPVWWLAWLAPAPVLVAALRNSTKAACVLALLAALIAASGHHAYFALLMPAPAAAVVTVLQALTWVFVIMAARHAMIRVTSPWSVLAYPLLWCALDTLLAHLHPDTNWDSLAYSQADVPAAVQIVALTGMAGLVFVLSLVPAAIALAAVRGWRAARPAAMAALALAAATFAFGHARIPATMPVAADPVGLAVIDDFIGPRTPPARVERIWSRYEELVGTLAAQGARIVVLPEKIATVTPDTAAQLTLRLSALAARTQVWLVAGIGTDEDDRKHNVAWLFSPDGRLDASYRKHHLAPPEREFLPGSAYDVRAIGRTAFGLAICKDMHFAAMGRAYGMRQTQAMLVPAWDFGVDGRYAARLSALRGVESGFAMVRASREGLLTVTDAYGRVVAETRSAPLPGATLLARVPAAPVDTFYARTGDWFGWLCTAAVLLGWIPLLRRRRLPGHAAEPA
ncbi:apolipoprotein N-acyltransferase [Nannocystis exedens]|uniref:Apolipoprotein N-acyltransferase n=1 Tax=Nannocystis exedens TaxID=54 RepID=A0A1I2IDF2_9BACT|nr:nitrilase-related carbon-nitrogen hydrolase [Nannocystis exedens]PCC73204.1 apolipoprotein N-acyltransferase [Nannocystis exedens]SFF39678.1 apolipoprotein N-acyltransferase [Nannocystis exedens]